MAGNIDPMKVNKMLEQNLLQAGKPAEVISKKEQEKLTSAQDTLNLHATLRDQVKFSDKAHKAASHTGALGAQGLKQDKKLKEEAPGVKPKAQEQTFSKETIGHLKDGTPVTTDLIADLTQANPNLKPGELKAVLEQAAKDGIINKEAAVKLAKAYGQGAKASTGAAQTTPPPAAPPTGTGATETAENFKKVQDDLQNAYTIYAQMAASRQKWMMQMWQIMQDLQTSIMEIIQSVITRRMQAVDEAHKAWTKVFRSDY